MLPMPELPRTDEGKRICQVIKVRPERLAEYKHVHANGWPEVKDALRKAHIVGGSDPLLFDTRDNTSCSDYSIHFYEPLNLLIAHMRYIGPEGDFVKDMEGIKESEATRRWWAMTDGMQESFIEGATGSEGPLGWWADTEEVFRMEG
ncbi:L-rhamnose mutarotase, partial [Tremellales sp. Uapishka_1]